MKPNEAARKPEEIAVEPKTGGELTAEWSDLADAIND